jgi:hypothetical protein
MINKDLDSIVVPLQVSVPAARTSTVTGAAVNLAGYAGAVLIVQDVGAVSGTTPTLDGKIQDSPDGSGSWADVPGATLTQVTAANNIQAINVDRRLAKAFIRYVGTIAGTTPSFTLGVTALAQNQIQ